MCWRWALASEIGTLHVRLGTRKQDATSCFEVGNGRKAICAIVCDGAGSAEFGGEGASVICRTLSEALRRHFQQSNGLPKDDDIWPWVDLARDRIGFASHKRGKTPRDFASTMVMLVATSSEALTVHVGDGAVVARLDDHCWQTLSKPENGEYAATTFFVTDDPSPRLRISRFFEDFTGFALFSDGIENLALDQQTGAPHVPFFRSMLNPLDHEKVYGRNPRLSTALATFLNGKRICDRTDDDKTLVIISSK